MIVTLSPEQYEEAKAIALARRRNDKSWGGRDRLEGTMAEGELLGVMGEYSVRSLFGLPPPPMDWPDHGIDLVLPDGRSCAVKTRRHMAPSIVRAHLRPGKESLTVEPRFSTHRRLLECDVGVFCQPVPAKVFDLPVVLVVHPRFSGSPERSIEVVGWLSREEFASPLVHHLYDYGRGLGPQPAVCDHQLHTMYSLLAAQKVMA